jgi:pyruvate dehydrogenase E2 component (dihydrolipoamide acetyltransferase)
MMDIVLPAVSPTMEKGTLARWRVAVGSAIQPGDVIAELETDKASVEISAESAGVLREIVVPAGSVDVPVGTVIARLEAGTGTGTLTGSKQARDALPLSPGERVPGGEVSLGRQVPGGEVSLGHQVPGGEVLASPLARRLARQLGIDLGTVRGTGSHGRITKADLEAVDARLRSRPALPHSAATGAAEVIHPPPHGVPLETLPLSAMRKTIARRLGESKRSVPHFYMSVDVDVDALLELRAQCNARPGAVRLSLNDFILRAVALSLVAVPEANVQYAGDAIHRFTRVDISVAVALDAGLVTPIVRDAAHKGVQTIAEEMRGLVEKAKAGRLHPSDYEGGTFSISNLGMYGIKQFEAVINPPQGAILAVGATERRVVPVGDEICVRNQLTATLSCDHRVIDGAVGARLLGEIKRGLEDPLGLLLG